MMLDYTQDKDGVGGCRSLQRIQLPSGNSFSYQPRAFELDFAKSM